jgi:hypothetical protein
VRVKKFKNPLKNKSSEPVSLVKSPYFRTTIDIPVSLKDRIDRYLYENKVTQKNLYIMAVDLFLKKHNI